MRYRSGSIAAVLLVVTGLLGATASARSAAVPRNTTAPALSGQAREESSLTVSTGAWENSPTSYSYQWQRCVANGGSCTSIAGATNRTYTLTAADVDHTVRALVTATNADGSATVKSNTSQLVASNNAPTNTASRRFPARLPSATS